MRKVFLATLIIAIFSIASTCRKNRPDCHVYYKIKNNSSSAIYFKWTRDSTLNLMDYPPGASSATYKCEANETKNNNYGGCFEAEINFSSTKKLTIWIFDAHVIETIPWDTVKKDYMILRKYSFTKAQLDSANWTINYP